MTTCQEQGVELAIGFGRKLSGTVGYGHLCHSFADLKDVLQRLKPDMEADSTI